MTISGLTAALLCAPLGSDAYSLASPAVAPESIALRRLNARRAELAKGETAGASETLQEMAIDEEKNDEGIAGLSAEQSRENAAYANDDPVSADDVTEVRTDSDPSINAGGTYQAVGDNAAAASGDSVPVSGSYQGSGSTGTEAELDGSGQALNGFVSDNGTTKYYRNGISEEGLISDGGKYYCLVAGQLVKDAWYAVNYAVYYFQADGSAAVGSTPIGDHYYCFTLDGKLCPAGWRDLGGLSYYVLADGSAAVGWLDYGGARYYLQPDGQAAKGKVSIGSDTYLFNGEGKMMVGWQKIGNDINYYGTAGIMAKGLTEIDGATYYFDDRGAMFCGGTTINGTFYCFDQEGRSVAGFTTANGLTYYYINGVMQTGFVSVGGLKLFFNTRGQLLTSTAKKIIDVSEWQGNINWDALKAANDVDGVIVRCAYGGLSKYTDSKFYQNVAAMNRLGIPYGAYLYSYAENTAEAAAEAENCAAQLKGAGASLSYPVYYDLEANKYTSHLTKDEYTAIALTFIHTLEAKGYTVKIYSYLSLLNNKLFDPQLLPYVDWVAQYDNWRCNYELAPYSGWQFTSTGSAAGISGNVDISVWLH